MLCSCICMYILYIRVSMDVYTVYIYMYAYCMYVYVLTTYMYVNCVYVSILYVCVCACIYKGPPSAIPDIRLVMSRQFLHTASALNNNALHPCVDKHLYIVNCTMCVCVTQRPNRGANSFTLRRLCVPRMYL